MKFPAVLADQERVIKLLYISTVLLKNSQEKICNLIKSKLEKILVGAAQMKMPGVM